MYNCARTREGQTKQAGTRAPNAGPPALHLFFPRRNKKVMAKTICKILGVVFVLVGLAGFADAHLLGAHLNGTHNIVHLVSGALALYFGFAGTLSAARLFCIVFGIVYLLLGVCGFLLGTGADRMLAIDDLLMLGTMDHIIHVLLGLIFLIGGFLTRADLGGDRT